MSRTQRHNERIRRRNRRSAVFITIIFLLIIALALSIIIPYVSSNIYRDADGFEDYAASKLEKYDRYVPDGKVETEYHYDPPVSYAVWNGECDNESVVSYRDGIIDSMVSSFTAEKKAAEAERTEGEDKDEEDALQHALLIRSGVYTSDNGVTSLAIYSSGQIEKDKDMRRESSAVSTYHFLSENGKLLKPQQVFTEDYKEVCSKYFTQYFQKKYKPEELNEGWENCVSASDGNYNEYVVMNKNVTFYFDKGAILKKASGVIAVQMPAADLVGVLREKPVDRYVDPSKPMVALTYDDGPGGKAEQRILDCLEKSGDVATFFYVGNRISRDKETVKRAYDIGCQIGSHTWNHPKLSKLTTDEVSQQFANTNAALRDAIDADASVFRPSYGITNDTVNKLAGVPVVMWDVDTLDWKSRDANSVFEAVKSKSSLDGSIILMHSIYESTADATELIVPWLNENGYQLVTVDELIRAKTGGSPQPGTVYHGF